jgi:tetratricopeptide (TPR) repeat protein
MLEHEMCQDQATLGSASESFESSEAASAAIETRICQASALMDAGETLAAEQAYTEAERLLGTERSPRHAEVLVCLAMLMRRRGLVGEAANHLDMALLIFPEHRAALTQRLAIAREQDDLATSAALRARMVAFCESDSARVHVLSEVVDDAVGAALCALQTAICLNQGDRELKERLRALREATGDYPGAVDAMVAIAEDVSDKTARARTLADAANLCAQKTGNTDRAVALFEAAIVDDPTVPGAFDAIEAVLVEAGDVEGTERAYARQLERLRAGGHQAAELQLLRKLSELREDRLADLGGAIAAQQRILELSPTDLAARIALGRLLEARGSVTEALACLEAATALAPTEPGSYRALHRLSVARRDIDHAFFAASALVYLGEAEESEQALYRQYATMGVTNVERPLDEASLALLRPGDHGAIRCLLGLVHDAAIEAKLAALRMAKQTVMLDERQRHDPEQSTVSAVRGVDWVRRLLGLPSAALYVQPGQGFALAHPMTAQPSIVLGGGMLTGRSVAELLFRTGYELGIQRELGRLPVFYPTTAELLTLVSAAVGLCMPASLPSDAVGMAAGLKEHLEPGKRQQLEQVVQTIVRDGVVLDAAAMLRDLELLASRVGLIAAGDLTVAARQVTIESRATAGLRPADRVRDLLGFAVSQAHARVRETLGMSVLGAQALRDGGAG